MYALDQSFPAVAERYLLARGGSAGYQRQIRSRARHWAKSMDNIPADRTTAEMVSEYVQMLESTITAKGTPMSPKTIKGYRTAVLALARFAGASLTGEIRRPRMTEQPVDSWLIDEIRELAAMAADLRGTLPNGVSRRSFWLSAIHSGYSTGMSFGDLMRLRTNSIPPTRALEFARHKTGKVVHVRFSAAAMAAIQSHGQNMALPWPETYETFRLAFRWLVRFSGIRQGTFKWLRRSAGSYADLDGRGPELLGNTRQVFDKHYRVRAIASPMPPEPPEL